MSLCPGTRDIIARCWISESATSAVPSRSQSALVGARYLKEGSRGRRRHHIVRGTVPCSQSANARTRVTAKIKLSSVALSRIPVQLPAEVIGCTRRVAFGVDPCAAASNYGTRRARLLNLKAKFEGTEPRPRRAVSKASVALLSSPHKRSTPVSAARGSRPLHFRSWASSSLAGR